MIRVYEPWIAKNQIKYVNEALARNELTYRGEFVPRFESALAEYIGAKHVIATANGTVSLFAAYSLFAENSTVAVPSLTYAATVSQLLLAGHIPAYVNSNNYQMDIAEVLSTLWQVKGVVCPFLYADVPHDFEKLQHECSHRNIPLIVDAAEAFGCFKGLRGDVYSYSFFANKIITTGEGGCLATNSDKIAKQLRSFCNHHTLQNYEHSGPGSNFRMGALQAAIGLAQLEDVDEIISRKRSIAAIYRKFVDKRFTPVVPRIWRSSEWMPVFKLPDGIEYSALQQYCELYGVEIRPTFKPLHNMRGFEGELLFAIRPNQPGFILPCGPSLTTTELLKVVEVVNSFCGAL